MQQIILAIAGKPGLYKLVSRAKNNLIVEALDATHKRMPAFATDKITSLGDIAMFTETDDVPLMDVMENIKTLENGQKASINEKKASGKELQDYFTKVLPEWDRDRVQNSHIKKLITWPLSDQRLRNPYVKACPCREPVPSLLRMRCFWDEWNPSRFCPTPLHRPRK